MTPSLFRVISSTMNDWACLSVALLDGDGSMYEYLSSNRKTMKAKRHEEDSPDKGVQCNRVVHCGCVLDDKFKFWFDRM
ncbi:hypothetical protein DY000_02024188 [Brassica cretica]|uniref:Uncharacterized protein n=1 Tax=Brassica cretica TaxID=69181 RepID=A0ABQ7E5U6_BRACR|nr:hypothetical protein DY000_02024188 [Brassica cretica]